MDQPPAMVTQCFSNTQCTTHTWAGSLRPPQVRFLFQNHIVKPLVPSRLLCFRVILFDRWWALTVLLWWKTFTKWRKLSSCWHNRAVLLTNVTQAGSVSEMSLHYMSVFSFLTDNTPTPTAVLLCLVSTSDLLACIYSDHYNFPLKTTIQQWFSLCFQHFPYSFSSS